MPSNRNRKISLPGDLSPRVIEVLDASAHSLAESGAIVICGLPASGKSTAATYLADRIGAPVFDKDGFAPGLEEAVMTRLTGDPFDRDSDVYRTVVSPHLYDGLVHAAFTVAAHHPVIIDAPLISFIRQAASSGSTLTEYLWTRSGLTPNAIVTTMWFDSANNDIRTRMLARGAARDVPKLTNWDTYESQVLDGGVRTAARAIVDIVVTN
ncbi:AAA family ATPase [Nocardia arthritidis]|uniref:AAA family ATPase n=1 Tax=Nocardia arthritidis TaxID=228602 RepID=UPI00142DEA15|nr:AAA family ATPase [Nocardia arthritidis]